jgi:hypothetical protein
VRYEQPDDADVVAKADGKEKIVTNLLVQRFDRLSSFPLTVVCPAVSTLCEHPFSKDSQQKFSILGARLLFSITQFRDNFGHRRRITIK